MHAEPGRASCYIKVEGAQVFASSSCRALVSEEVAFGNAY